MSTTKRNQTTQKRTSRSYPSRFQTYDLPADFPILLCPRWAPTKDPILYLHFHDCLQIGYCHEGAGILLVGDAAVPYRQGCVSVIRPRELHFMRSDPAHPAVWSFIFLDPQRLLGRTVEAFDMLNTAMLGSPNLPPVFPAGDHPAVSATVKDLIAELGEPGKRRAPQDRDMVRSLVSGLLIRLHRLRSSAIVKTSAPATVFQRLVPALEHITSRWSEPLSIPALAAACGMGARHFDRCFKRVTGRRPLDYITRLRVAMICGDLASTGKTVIAAALDNGYSSLANFNKAFKRVMGMAPARWRESVQDGDTTHQDR